VEPLDTLSTTDVEREILIAAPPDVVFPYFTDAERMCRWMGVSAELDARPRGVFRVDVNGRDIARGEYLEVVPYSRIVFTWGWEAPDHEVPPGSSRVEVTLHPAPEGTVVRLRHRGLSEAMREAHGHGRK
jgi:uncharacterized protein YndB with AHSA1/START domain